MIFLILIIKYFFETKFKEKEIIREIKNTYVSIEKFIDNLWNLYQEKLEKNDLYYDKKVQERIKKMNIKFKIKANRSRFKENIFLDRKNKGLINTKDELYSDVIDINGEQEKLLSKFNESEAAHIFDVWKIKKTLLKFIEKKNDDEDYIDYIKNPNNGIIMKHDYNKSYDRNQRMFDSNDEMKNF